MLNVHAAMPATNISVPATLCTEHGTTEPQPLVNKGPAAAQMFELGFQSIEMDAANLCSVPEDVAIGQLAEAIHLADQRAKPELNINNIAPWINVGQKEAAQVPIIQDKIQQQLAAACLKLKRAIPECRLDLRQGEFGIRCYMGRFKPTDHIFEEDLISDSR